MELIGTVILILIAAGLNIANFVVGYRNTPPGNVFLGTIHHPQDYFYYLSQFTQGMQSWFLSRNLYTSDFPHATAVGWVNVIMGRLFGGFGIPPMWAYALSVVLWTGLLLLCVSRLLREVFPGRQSLARFLALTFFLVSNSFPILTPGQPLAYQTYWSNYGEPFVRLGGVPHHLIMHTMVVLSMLISLLLVRTGTRRKTAVLAAGLAAVSLTLGSINPVQWLWTGAAIGLTMLLSSGRQLFHPTTRIAALRGLAPAGIYIAAGLPVLLYLRQLFSAPPYAQLSAWEATQQVTLSLAGLFQASGPLFVLGLLGLPVLLHHRSPARILLTVYAAGSLVLFFSPLPGALSLSNIRFVSGITVLAYTASAAGLAAYLFHQRRLLVRLPMMLIISGAILLCGMSFSVQFMERTVVDPKNAFIYVPTTVMDGFRAVVRETPDDATVLAYWPFEASLPAFTGRQVYFGHPLLTTDFERKSGEAYFFIDNRWTPEQMQDFLREKRIDYIFVFRNALKPRPFVVPVYENDNVGLYRVSLAP